MCLCTKTNCISALIRMKDHGWRRKRDHVQININIFNYFFVLVHAQCSYSRFNSHLTCQTILLRTHTHTHSVCCVQLCLLLNLFYKRICSWKSFSQCSNKIQVCNSLALTLIVVLFQKEKNKEIYERIQQNKTNKIERIIVVIAS